MLTMTVIGPGAKYGDFAAGYFRPSAPGQFVPLVVGCPTWDIASAEAVRLTNEQRARDVRALQEQSLLTRGVTFFTSNLGGK